MRVKRVKKKIFSDTPIPERLRLFFQYVDDLIVQGCESTTTSGDDLIQNGDACGGLLEDDGDIFGFSYYVGSGTNGRWELILSREQIANIARNQIQSLGLWGCSSDSCKFASMSQNETCINCDYDEESPPIVPVPDSPLNHAILRAFKVGLSPDKYKGEPTVEKIKGLSPHIICRLTEQVSDLENAIKDLMQIVEGGNLNLMHEIQKVTYFEWITTPEYEDAFLGICREMLTSSLYRLEWEKNKAKS